MNDAGMLLIFDGGIYQELIGDRRWRDVQVAPTPLVLHCVESVYQEINEPGWQFTVKFVNNQAAGLARHMTGWEMSRQDNTVLFATSSVDYITPKPELIVTTQHTEIERILWRSWKISANRRNGE